MATPIHSVYYGGGGSINLPSFGGEFTVDRPIPHTVNLHGTEFPIELRDSEGRQLYRRQSLDRFRQAAVDSDQADDSQFNNDGQWMRYAYSWHLGTGQDVQDFGDDWSPVRFGDSRGIDPWDEFCVTLLPDTEEVRDGSGSVQLVVATGGFVYHWDGTDVYRSSDLSTWNQITSLTGTVQAMTTDGSTCYIATTTHVFTVDDGGGTAAATYTTVSKSYDSIAFVGNRLVAGVAAALWEIDNAGVPTLFDTHYQSAFRWKAIFAIGSRIYIGGYAGNRTEIFATTVNESGTLVRSYEAAPFPHGELLNAVVSYGGQAVLCTSLGVRIAILSGDGTLTYGPLIDAPGDVLAAAVEGRFCWFGWEDFFGEGSGVGRLALDTAVRPLQPAYASDVMTPDASAAVTGVARFGGRTLFAVGSAGLYASHTTDKVASGWVESGEVYLGTIEDKRFLSLRTQFDALAAGESVDVNVVNEHADVLANRAGIASEQVELVTDHEHARWAKIKVTLHAGTSNLTSPSLRAWRIRGWPITPMIQEWIVPLIIHRHVVVNDADGQLRSIDQLEAVERLIDACEDQTVVAYREGARTYRVRIDKYEWNPGEWDDTSDFFDGLFVARLLTG